MKFIPLALLLALVLIVPPLAGQVTATSPGGRTVIATPIPSVVLHGVLYDAGGMWVTDFVLPTGILVTVPHDPALGDLILITVPNTPSFFVSLSALKDWTDNDDDWILPVTAGSAQCWLVPYGPPNPDGSWPLQLWPTSFLGEGASLSSAVADYHAQVAEAISEGAEPAPGDC